MRALTLLVTPPEDLPPARLFGEESGLVGERIYNLNVLEDGTLVLLGRMSGDLDRARAVLGRHGNVLGFSVSGEDADGGLVFVHASAPPVIERFLTLPREHEVFFEFPIEMTREGRYRVVVAGETNGVLQQALGDIPRELAFTVERIGPYLEDQGAITGLLTDRQREVLEAARDLGYYEVPRGATHADIAERLDISVGTVGEHLQKIEARVLGA